MGKFFDMEIFNNTVLRSTHLIAGIAACAAVAANAIAPQACSVDSDQEAALRVAAVLAVASALPVHLRAAGRNTSVCKAVAVGVSMLASCVLSKLLVGAGASCHTAMSSSVSSSSSATAAWLALAGAAICESAVCFLNLVSPSDASARAAAVAAAGGIAMMSPPVSTRQKFASNGAQPLLPLSRPVRVSSRAGLVAPRMAYVPDGLSKEEWKKLQEKEKAKKKGLGRAGPRGYKSRSFKSFQESLERGEAKHLFPVDPKKVKSGEIPIEDVPYMQRGGAWDGSDLKGQAKSRALKKKTASPWLKSDKEYAAGGYKKDQSVSVFGGDALPWTNRQQARPKSAEEYEEKKKKKGPFGLW